MTEYSPPGRKIKMTKSQIKKYIKKLEEKRKIAKEKLEISKKSGEWKQEKKEVEKLENLINNL